MKLRKGYGFIEPSGTGTWMGDCPEWARLTRKYSPHLKEIRVIILSKKKLNCTGCTLGFH
jgi:hypothetical protein